MLFVSAAIPNCGEVVFIKGIIPEFLKQVTMGDSGYMFVALSITPIDVIMFSTWKASFTEIGTPYKGGKNFYAWNSPSSNVQFFFPVSFLLPSQFFAVSKAQMKLVSTIKLSYLPTMLHLKASAVKIYSEISSFLFNLATTY